MGDRTACIDRWLTINLAIAIIVEPVAQLGGGLDATGACLPHAGGAQLAADAAAADVAAARAWLLVAVDARATFIDRSVAVVVDTVALLDGRYACRRQLRGPVVTARGHD